MSTRCHVCGFDVGEPPWGETGRDPTFLICPCCGCAFGYEDRLASGVVRHRQRWSDAGFKWFRDDARPAGWSAEPQIRQLPRELPAGIEHDVTAP
jgi:hypothetical protein